MQRKTNGGRKRKAEKWQEKGRGRRLKWGGVNVEFGSRRGEIPGTSVGVGQDIGN